jgi:hypothetical protein
MITALRERLRRDPFLHGIYMRLKRRLRSELVGMTALSDQRYLERYGRDDYTGAGDVVDLGCWLGSTTIPLAKGLDQNPSFSSRKVHAYDLFIWADWMKQSSAGTGLEKKFRDGDSFVDEFISRLGGLAPIVEVHQGDLKTAGWSGAPIELLVVDAMKDWDLANAIVRDFYPCLIEGKSLVYHQDFAHYHTPWIHLIHWRLRDHFAFVDDVDGTCSVVFRCVKQLSPDLCEVAGSFEDFGGDEVRTAIEHSMSLVSKEKWPNIAAAEVMWFIHQQEFEMAESVFRRHQSAGIPMKGDMFIVRRLMIEAAKS